MRRIILSNSANRDFNEIWDYIAVENHSPVAADLLIDKFDQILRLLVTQPMMGEAVDRLRKATRRIVVNKRYLVFYEVVEEGIRVLRVLHGAQLIRPEDLA